MNAQFNRQVHVADIFGHANDFVLDEKFVRVHHDGRESGFLLRHSFQTLFVRVVNFQDESEQFGVVTFIGAVLFEQILERLRAK